MTTPQSIIKDKFWRNFFEEYVNSDEYWYQPKGFAIKRETLPIIFNRLRILANYQGQPWDKVQREYTALLTKKGLFSLRKAKKQYTASDFSAISRMNKVVFSNLGLAWVDGKSTVYITKVGEEFLKSKGKPAIIEEQILKYQFSNPSFPQSKSIKLFPHLFLLELLLNFPESANGYGITRDEYLLFVSRAASSDQVGQVIEHIDRFRKLKEQERSFLIEAVQKVPIITEGKFRALSRRESIFRTIELNSSYALHFLCFPHYISWKVAKICIPGKHWQLANDLVRKYHKEYFYTEFDSEKDWLSYYGDPTKKGTFKEALEYYETTSKLPQALETYSVALRKGVIKDQKPLNIEEYANLRFKEKMLEDFLEFNLHLLEKGLKLIRRQFPTLVGPIDILAIDSQKHYVVIELKKGKASDKVMGQLHRYIGFIEEEMSKGKYVRGTIVSQEIDKKLKYAFKAFKNPHLQLFKFQFTGKAEEIK